MEDMLLKSTKHYKMEYFEICRIPTSNNKSKKEISIQMAQSVVDKFDKIWKKKVLFYDVKKIGVKNYKKSTYTN